MIEKVNACYFSTAREFTIVVLDINRPFKFEFFGGCIRTNLLQVVLGVYLGMTEKARVILDGEVVDEAHAINLSHHQLVPLAIDLHSGDIVMGLLPVDHLPL